jgi:hypothetical protein
MARQALLFTNAGKRLKNAENLHSHADLRAGNFRKILF